MADIPNAASVALVAGGRVLAIRRALPPMAGLWTLPGGRLEPGETAEAAAMREIFEELGLRVGPLLPVARLAVGQYLLQVFATAAFSGEPVPSAEIAEWRWATPEDIARLATTPGLDAVVVRAIDRLAAPPHFG